jgi:hypothetical protein
MNIEQLIAASNKSTKFNVHQVTAEKFESRAGPKTLTELFKLKSDINTQNVEASSYHKEPLYGGQTNSFFSAIHHAYDKHIGLELHPDHFKLAILQGFSIHVNENAEKFRKLFVEHEGKKTVLVRRDDFVRGSPINPWEEVFTEFVDKINNDLNDKNLVQHVQSSLTTTTPTTMASFNISLMETMKQYFDCRFMTCCGIPFIDLKGTVDDWTSLVALVDHIQQYDLDWWTNEIRPLLLEIVNTVTNPENIDVTFWQDILKVNGGSGGPYYNGWICKFFPYLGSGKYQKNNFEAITDVPTGISSVPVTWDYLGTEIKLKFTAGFYGFTCTDNTLKPEISWLIHEELNSGPQIDANIMRVYRSGSYYSKSSQCYNGQSVNCDYCVKSIPKDDPCIHMRNTDLCMDCVVKIKDILKS